MEKQRIAFCDELRGLAAFIVMLSHFLGFNALHGYLYNPHTSEDIFPSWFLKLLPIDGAFGVAIFFLISGFIIPLSLQKGTAFKFLQARFIRIYPVYILSALITMLIGLILFDFNTQHTIIFFKSITLFRDWLGGAPIDGIVWTLEIEIKFYLYMALMLPFVRKKPIVVIIIPLLIISIFILLLKIRPIYPMESSWYDIKNILNVLLYNFGFLSYMNIGLIFYLYDIKKFDKLKATLWTLISFNYGVLFKRTFSGFLAKISYPLYTVHSTIGLVLLSVFTFKYNINPLIALVLVILFVIFVSYIIHVVIELPSIRKSSSLHKMNTDMKILGPYHHKVGL